MNDMRIVALNLKEREAVRAKLLEAIANGEDDGGHLQDVAEMLLRATLPGEVGALSDS